MKRIQQLAIALGTALCGLAQAADVGVSVSVSQPGFYGRVEIGDRQPVLVYPQPVIIHPGPVTRVQRPIYMHVPPGHYKRWDRYCARYRACGQPVYFVTQPVIVHPGRGSSGYDRDDRHDRREHWRDDRRGGNDRGGKGRHHHHHHH